MASLNDIETKVYHIIDILNARTIKTITGVLPLTFTTTEDKLRDWEIRGNDDVYEGQQGVGERTENLYNPDATDVNNGYVNPGRLRADGTIKEVAISTEVWVTEYIPVDPVTTYTLTDLIQTSSFGLCYYDSNKDYISGKVYNVRDHENKTVTTPNTCQYIRFTVGGGFNTMLVEGSTAPSTFIPYGYQIPLTVSQQGKPDKTVDIYIGDSPLTEGETVSKTSTGVDIATTEGENTISTTLYNKPEMTIKYK